MSNVQLAKNDGKICENENRIANKLSFGYIEAKSILDVLFPKFRFDILIKRLIANEWLHLTVFIRQNSSLFEFICMLLHF
jgi:hypothetical protein